MTNEDPYPSDEELEEIKRWKWEDGFLPLANRVCELWWGDGFATISGVRTDEFRHEYQELRLITGGWSGNESLVAALKENVIFFMVCWQSSHRGGLHVFHIRKIHDDT